MLLITFSDDWAIGPRLNSLLAVCGVISARLADLDILMNSSQTTRTEPTAQGGGINLSRFIFTETSLRPFTNSIRYM